MNASCLRDLHAAAGATLAGEPSFELLTYGDPQAEYETALAGAVVFDETDRGLLRLAGADARAFLHRIVANDVRGLELGRGGGNLMLSSKGKVLAVFDLLCTGESEFLAVTEPGAAGTLAASLDTYLFADQVELADLTAAFAPLALAGPAAAEHLRVLTAVESPAEDRAHVEGVFEGELVRILRAPVAGSPGFRVFGDPSGTPEEAAELARALWTALRERGVRAAGRIVHDSLRVEACRARAGVDVDENVYPQEARLEDGFSLEKGCYIGQEVVAKIDTYEGLNKRLVALRVDHEDPVPRGTRLWREDGGEWRDLGVVTSWAFSPALETGVVLGFVKRRHQAAGTPFRVGEGPATATVVQPPLREGALPPSGGFE